MSNDNKLGTFLKTSREKANLSQADVAKHMGYSTPQFVSNWERGVSAPPIKNLKRVAAYLKIDSEKLFSILLEQTIDETTVHLKKVFKRS